jgi:hypothetical protein
MKMKAYSRPRGTILNKIDVGAIPDIGDVMKIVTEKFDIPPGWDWPAKPYAPPAVDVALSVPEGLADLAACLGRAQGMTREKYMAVLLSEALHEALTRVRRQLNPPRPRKRPVCDDFGL